MGRKLNDRNTKKKDFKFTTNSTSKTRKRFVQIQLISYNLYLASYIYFIF